MGLRDLNLQPDYIKDHDNINEEFYSPCMKNSNQYFRITGYFGSTIYYICWNSIKEFVANGGHMKLICSPCLSDKDNEAIKLGYDLASKRIIDDSIIQEVEGVFSSENLSSSYKALSYLIYKGILEIKIGIPVDETSSNIERLFHDKVGLFIDSKYDKVAFRGPMNETHKGLGEHGNAESIDVFTSWEDGKDIKRLNRIEAYFNELWYETQEHTLMLDFPDEAYKKVKERGSQYKWDDLLKEIEEEIVTNDRWKPNKTSSGHDLRKHQVTALDNWLAAGRRGIFEHATGSGKTFTAICAIKDSLLRGEVPLVLVPAKELMYQWYSEIQKNISGISISYLLCGDGNIKWKTENLLNLYTKKNKKDQYFVIIAIMDTACKLDFLERVSQGENLFIVADEVHRLGSESRRNVFSLYSGPRLGLSATPYRYGDPEGTKAIIDYFGGIIEPKYLLKDAINDGVLTKYIYSPEIAYLNPDEEKEYEELSKVIKKKYAISNGDIEGNAGYKLLLLQRARILKEASAKIDLAKAIIEKNYKKGQKWIVYCDNINQLNCVKKALIRFNPFEYHSSMIGDREETLKYFNSLGGIMVSIKCLDEGVDIPGTTHALILASSKNPREYIQRRGRVLRTCVGKNLAYIFDAIILPKNIIDAGADNIVVNELARAIQFGEWAFNPINIATLKNIAIDFDIDINSVIDGGIEDEQS